MNVIFPLVCFILSLLSLVCANVPVLLWESSKSNRITTFSAMSTITNNELKAYLLKKVHGEKRSPLIVVFNEGSLSLEDFRDQEGETAFPEVKYITQNSPNTEFLASVQNPIDAFEQLTKVGYTLYNVNMDNKYEIPEGCGKVIMVKLQEAEPDEGRMELLRKHDKTIAEIYSQLLSKCSHVIGIVSGSQSSFVDKIDVVRVRRSSESDQNDTSTSSLTEYQDEPAKNVLMVTKSTPTMILNEKSIPLDFNTAKTVPNVSSDRSKNSYITLFLNFRPMMIKFNFDNLTSGYWYLRSATIESENETLILKPNKEIYAPLGMSYHSGSPVVFKNDTSTLTFKDLQVEPFFDNPGTTKFSDAVDDVMFFTPPIWSGIVVTFLLAIIFAWGISMILDIHTMDQFDDPKGKTITVSATD